MRLSDCFVDVVAYVGYFLKTVEKKQPPFDKVKGDIQRLLSQSQEYLQRGFVSQEDYEQARFAICAWVDERILSSHWHEKSQWMSEQLQRIYYQTTEAGEEFFERLNRLGPQQTDVREVYYLCLAMGFAGRYCHEGDEYLIDQLITANLKMLTGSSVGVPSIERGELFPGAYPLATEEESLPRKKKFRFSPFTLACIGVPIALFLVLSLIYRFVLSGISENLLSRIP
jgi:type VI secretion system protein ImpK